MVKTSVRPRASGGASFWCQPIRTSPVGACSRVTSVVLPWPSCTTCQRR